MLNWSTPNIPVTVRLFTSTFVDRIVVVALRTLIIDFSDHVVVLAVVMMLASSLSAEVLSIKSHWPWFINVRLPRLEYGAIDQFRTSAPVARVLSLLACMNALVHEQLGTVPCPHNKYSNPNEIDRQMGMDQNAWGSMRLHALNVPRPTTTTNKPSQNAFTQATVPGPETAPTLHAMARAYQSMLSSLVTFLRVLDYLQV